MHYDGFPIFLLPLARILYTTVMMTFTVDVIVRLRDNISYDPR